MQFLTLRQEIQVLADHSRRHLTQKQLDQIVTELLQNGWEIQSIVYPVTENKAFITRMVHLIRKED